MTATISGDGTSTLINLTTSGNTILGDASTDTLNVGNGGLVKDASGNVGIGTASPAYKLNVEGERIGLTNGNSGAWITHLIQNQVGTAFYIGNESSSGGTFVSTPYSRFLWSSGAYPMVFGVNGAERMRIDSSGNLLVGSTTVGSYTSGIVVGNSSSAKAVTLPVNGGGATFNGVDTVNQPSAGFTIGHINSTAQFACRVGSTGGLQLNGAGATTWTSLSDETTKDIIEPITDAANKVSTLRAVIGKYKTDEEGVRRSFLIAQDVQAVLPEAVSLIKQELGSEETSLGLSYTDVIPLLVAAIKEQQAIITQLQADVEALKAQP